MRDERTPRGRLRGGYSKSWWRSLYFCQPFVNKAFSLPCPAAKQINCNKRKRLHKKRVQLPQYWFGTQTWPPFQCSRTPIWPRDVIWKRCFTFKVLVMRPLKISFNSLWIVCYIYNKQFSYACYTKYNWLPITRTLANSNLALTRAKFDFPRISIIHSL